MRYGLSRDIIRLIYGFVKFQYPIIRGSNYGLDERGGGEDILTRPGNSLAQQPLYTIQGLPPSPRTEILGEARITPFLPALASKP